MELFSTKLNTDITKKIILLFLIIIILLILIEVSLRIAGDIYLDRLFVEDRNEKGYLETFNIVALGESTTAGIFVEYNESYPAQLQEMLQRRERIDEFLNTLLKEEDLKELLVDRVKKRGLGSMMMGL